MKQLDKGITVKICMLCFVLTNSVLLNLLYVWISFSHSKWKQTTPSLALQTVDDNIFNILTQQIKTDNIISSTDSGQDLQHPRTANENRHHWLYRQRMTISSTSSHSKWKQMPLALQTADNKVFIILTQQMKTDNTIGITDSRWQHLQHPHTVNENRCHWLYRQRITRSSSSSHSRWKQKKEEIAEQKTNLLRITSALKAGQLGGGVVDSLLRSDPRQLLLVCHPHGFDLKPVHQSHGSLHNQSTWSVIQPMKPSTKPRSTWSITQPMKPSTKPRSTWSITQPMKPSTKPRSTWSITQPMKPSTKPRSTWSITQPMKPSTKPWSTWSITQPMKPSTKPRSTWSITQPMKPSTKPRSTSAASWQAGEATPM